MKKTVFFSLFITLKIFGQSITIAPSNVAGTPNGVVKTATSKIGLEHTDGTIRLNTYIGTTSQIGGWLQTYTDHPLVLSTSNGNAQVFLNNNGNIILNPSDGKTGNVGIGIEKLSLPNYKLDINGRTRIRHSGETAGLWFNKSDNTEGAFTGMYDNNIYGFFGMGTVSNWKFAFDLVNTKMGIGTFSPKHPLTFPDGLGDKISFFGGNALATNDHYGIGIQGSALQLFVPTVSENIVFGTGRSGAFIEKMRINGGGNVGIGTVSPTLAGLVVNKAVGNAHAVFGSNTTGVSIESSWPGISLNGYYSDGRKPLANGFVGGMAMNPVTGLISIYNSATSGTAGTNITATEKFFINNIGNVGIGINNPTSTLGVVRGTGVNGTAVFYGTNHSSHFNYDTNEDTYIRGGKNNAKVIINDVTGLGNVGIGTATPNYKLQVNTIGNSAGIVHANNAGIQVGTFTGFGLGWYGTLSNHPLALFVNNGEPTVTITTSEQLQVGGAATPAGFKMSVDGKVICTEIEVLVTPWPDYVFKPNYKLKPLQEVENFITKNGHLPNIPKAEDIENKSLAVGNMAKLQMEKIEELTLYLIEINKRLEKVENENVVLKAELKSIKSQN